MPGFVHKYDQCGFSLVEVLITLLLGIMLITGITRVYIDNKRHYLYEEELAHLQENGRVVLNVLRRELRMAGFFAGAHLAVQTVSSVPVSNDCYPGWTFDLAYPLDFIDNPSDLAKSASGASFAECIRKGRNIQPGTDVLAIKRLAGMPTIKEGIYTDTGYRQDNKKQDSFYLKITDAKQPVFEYVQDDFSKDVLNPSGKTSMWLYHAMVFYVRDYSVQAGDQVPTLMLLALQDKSMTEMALVEGVEALHIEWGIASEQSGITPVIFVANPDGKQIAMVQLARIYLLMRTRNPLRGHLDTQSYRLGSLPAIKPGGHFLRYLFTMTVRLRN